MKQRWFDKIWFFVKRYWLAETVSAVGSYALAWLGMVVLNDKIVSSYAGSIGAFIGFYIVIYIKELKVYKAEQPEINPMLQHGVPEQTSINYKVQHSAEEHLNAHPTLKRGVDIHSTIIKNLLIEFGLSEVIDLFISRPACLYFAQILIPDFTVAIIVGSITANIFFFAFSGFMFGRKTAVTNFLVKMKTKTNPHPTLKRGVDKPKNSKLNSINPMLQHGVSEQTSINPTLQRGVAEQSKIKKIEN
jgi:hypothetical protein